MQTEQTQIRQLLQELPDQGLLCLLMECDISCPTLVDLTSNFFVIYIIIHSGWSPAQIFMKESQTDINLTKQYRF